MSGTTTNLSLFKYNPNTDGDQTFNIDNALNNNWDSLDSLIGALTNLTTTQKASLVGAINEIVTNMGGKAAKDLGNLDATGQAIIDAKIEAEALTAQNGYIKFKLNGISIIINWGAGTPTSNNKLVMHYPCSYTTVGVPVIVHNGSGWVNTWVSDTQATQFTIMTTNNSGTRWIAIGY